MITRLELIDLTKPLEEGGGRTVMISPEDDLLITYELQDQNRTLKIFIKESEETTIE